MEKLHLESKSILDLDDVLYIYKTISIVHGDSLEGNFKGAVNIHT